MGQEAARPGWAATVAATLTRQGQDRGPGRHPHPSLGSPCLDGRLGGGMPAVAPSRPACAPPPLLALPALPRLPLRLPFPLSPQPPTAPALRLSLPLSGRLARPHSARPLLGRGGGTCVACRGAALQPVLLGRGRGDHTWPDTREAMQGGAGGPGLPLSLLRTHFTSCDRLLYLLMSPGAGLPAPAAGPCSLARSHPSPPQES